MGATFTTAEADQTNSLIFNGDNLNIPDTLEIMSVCLKSLVVDEQTRKTSSPCSIPRDSDEDSDGYEGVSDVEESACSSPKPSKITDLLERSAKAEAPFGFMDEIAVNARSGSRRWYGTSSGACLVSCFWALYQDAYIIICIRY
jgi:hypothetical protein